MLRKFVGGITLRIAKFYAATWVGKFFANRRAARAAKTAEAEVKDVMSDIIEEARQRAADAMAGRGIYASMSQAERQAEFDRMLDRVISLTEMRNADEKPEA